VRYILLKTGEMQRKKQKPKKKEDMILCRQAYSPHLKNEPKQMERLLKGRTTKG
jgi:hypothetical protein